MQFTVVLMLPDTVAETYGHDAHIANVESETIQGAIDAARKEAQEIFVVEPDDFFLLCVFPGHHLDVACLAVQENRPAA